MENFSYAANGGSTRYYNDHNGIEKEDFVFRAEHAMFTNDVAKIMKIIKEEAAFFKREYYKDKKTWQDTYPDFQFEDGNSIFIEPSVELRGQLLERDGSEEEENNVTQIAVVLIPSARQVALGSVIAAVIITSPSLILGRSSFFCTSVPASSMGSAPRITVEKKGPVKQARPISCNNNTRSR